MADDGLLSTGEVARRLGRGQTSVRTLAREGLIPAGTRIAGSGRLVWRESDFPAIVAALAERGGRRQRRSGRIAA